MHTAAGWHHSRYCCSWGVIKKGHQRQHSTIQLLLQWVRMVMSIVYNDLCPIDRQSSSGVSRRREKSQLFFSALYYTFISNHLHAYSLPVIAK